MTGFPNPTGHRHSSDVPVYFQADEADEAPTAPPPSVVYQEPPLAPPAESVLAPPTDETSEEGLFDNKASDLDTPDKVKKFVDAFCFSAPTLSEEGIKKAVKILEDRAKAKLSGWKQVSPRSKTTYASINKAAQKGLKRFEFDKILRDGDSYMLAADNATDDKSEDSKYGVVSDLLDDAANKYKLLVDIEEDDEKKPVKFLAKREYAEIIEDNKLKLLFESLSNVYIKSVINEIDHDTTYIRETMDETIIPTKRLAILALEKTKTYTHDPKDHIKIAEKRQKLSEKVDIHDNTGSIYRLQRI
ncbi:MAG: hypothetical protein HOC94_00070 [Waddliaceae bacterium]|nr:hypothetical protein [Waddliaceae bacterium]